MLTEFLLSIAVVSIILFYRHREGELRNRLNEAVIEKEKAQDKFRTILFSIGEGTITTDVAGHVTGMNRIAEKLTGWREAEAKGKPLEEVFHVINEGTRTADENLVSQILAGQSIDAAPNQRLLVSKSGTEYPVANSAVPIRDADEEITGVVVVFRDQSPERAAEKDLKESEEKFRKAFNTSSDAININRVGDGVYLSVNEGFVRLTGFSEEDVLDKTSVEIGIWDDLADLNRLVSGLHQHGEVHNLEAKFRTKDGRVIHGLMSGAYIEIGGVPLIITVAKDVTELKALSEQLAQSQKLEAIGSLAGGIAHDYNNMLGVVIGYTQILEKKLKGDESTDRPVKAILNAARRAADLTKQILAFARKEMVSPEVINLNSAIESLREMLLRLIGENLSLVFVPGEGLWNIRLDPSQLDQVLINLATNARDAIVNTGTIRISTSNVTISETTGRILPNISHGEYVKIEFSDTGKGMDRETLKRAFEPFFTTKPKGSGTGLGLSTLYGIVKQNNGYVEVASEVGAGTTFEIYFPRCAEEVEPVRMALTGKVTGGSETILVVEDQADLLELARITLEGHGYKVLTALDPAEAARLCTSHPIDLLVTDVIMPQMNGKELSDHLRGIRPGLGTLFMSGYTADMLAPQGVLQDKSEFLQKPFTQEELSEHVHSLLSK